MPDNLAPRLQNSGRCRVLHILFRTSILILTTALMLSVALAEQAGNSVTVISDGYVKPVKGRELIPGVSDSGARHVASTVTLVRGDGVIIVADPGMVSHRSDITDALKQEGVTPEQVTHVFISHHHPDHTINIALFPDAEIIDYRGRYKGDLWEDHGDRYIIAEGITVLKTPGHTREDASLLVETASGNYVLTHLWWLADMTPAKDPLAYSQTVLEKNREKILATADWIIPGHGGLFRNPHKN